MCMYKSAGPGAAAPLYMSCVTTRTAPRQLWVRGLALWLIRLLVMACLSMHSCLPSHDRRALRHECVRTVERVIPELSGHVVHCLQACQAAAASLARLCKPDWGLPSALQCVPWQ